MGRVRAHPALVRILGVVVAVLALLTLVGSVPAARADDTSGSGDRPVELILFWGDGCPHCAAEKAWLDEIDDDYPSLTLTLYEVWYDEDNQRLFLETGERLGFEPSGVPTTIIGERVWVGFSDPIADEIERTIQVASRGDEPAASKEDEDTRVDVPLVGEVSLTGRSLVFSTFVIGFVDGVNPCSLWVISVLLTIVVRSGSRRRVAVIGSTFLLVTAAMYAVYMAGLYSALSVASHLDAIQLAVATVAVVMGAVSIKDYLAPGRGFSFSIRESSKPGIYRRIRDASGRPDLLAALGATVVLAVGVSLLETPCTAGFPVLWTDMLAAHDVAPAGAALLFVVYMVPFLLDELIVFALAVATMRAAKIQERHGALLKLVAGTTMLALAATLLVRPETMEDPLGALVVFALAFGVAGLVHAVVTRTRDVTPPPRRLRPH